MAHFSYNAETVITELKHRIRMGNYLNAPVTEKESIDEESDRMAYGASAMQGWRTDQEVRPADGGKLFHYYCFAINIYLLASVMYVRRLDTKLKG